MACLTFSRISLGTRGAASTVLDITVRALEASKDVITTVAPVPGLSVALSVTIALLKPIQDARSNCGALVSLCAETKSLADTLEGLAKIIEAGLSEYPAGSLERMQATERVSGSSKLVDRLRTLEGELHITYAEAGTLNKRTAFGRLLHSTGDAKIITTMRDRIVAARKRFQFEEGVRTEAIVTDILSDVKEVIAALKAAEEERVLAAMSRAEEAHYLSAANAMKARLEQGTRQQALDCLEEWEEQQIADSGSQPVCVLVGEAGTGKSTIASEFSKRLQRRGRLGASFFFTRGVQDLNSPRKVFSTIAMQLARSQPALRVPVVDAAREHLKTASLQQLEHEFDDLIRKPLGTLSPSHSPIFVVIDALDECTEEGRDLVPELLKLLLSEVALRTESPLRVLLTSRPVPLYIHDALSTSELKPRISFINIQTFRDSVDRDIELFIRTRLVANAPSQNWYDKDTTVVLALVKKSDGLFVYARTAVDFILTDLDQSLIQERYETLMRVEGTFGLVPLDMLYCAVLENVFPLQSRVAGMHDRLKRVLEYLVALQDPKGVSPATLEKLTGMPTTESVPILNKLRSIVLFERDNVEAPFRIIHATFREFLVDKSRSGEAFYVNAEQVHGRLADDCMKVVRSYLDDRWRGHTGTPEILCQLFSQGAGCLAVSPYVQYAYTFHDHHLRHAPHMQPPTLRHDPWNGRAVDPEFFPLIPTLASYMRDPDRSTAEPNHDRLLTIIDRLRQSLPAGDKFQDALSEVTANLTSANWGRMSSNFFDQRGFYLPCVVLCIVLDIHAVKCAMANEATDPTCLPIGSAATVDDRDVLSLTSALRETTNDAQHLISAHMQFHNLIISAGFTPGHKFDDTVSGACRIPPSDRRRDFFVAD